ncbi:MAG: GAF domain-containing protein, partial [Bacteroidota bacterium]
GKPFDMQAFYFTPAMMKMMASCKMKVKLDTGGEECMATLAARAGAVILNQHYGQNLEVDPTFIFSLQPAGCCYQNHYKSQLNIQYVEVVPVKPLKKLSKQRIHKLLSNIYDMDAWLEALPPDHFELHGVIGINLIDVTKEETLSRLRFHLLEKDAVVKAENIVRLEEHVKGYFGLPDLRLGLMALDYPGDRKHEYKYKIRHCFLADQHDCLLDPHNAYSVYDKACKYRETVLVEDLEELEHKTPIEKSLLQNGIRSHLVAPLLNKEGEVIGILEVGSPHPYELNSFAELAFKELLPLFNLAVERSREETDNQIEAIIREKFTAIHPSVEWRFVESAFNYLDNVEKHGKKAPVEQIVFEDVFPLYAQSDIVSSSVTRNRAIQEDFAQNLELIKKVLEGAVKQVDFPLLHHYLLESD